MNYILEQYDRSKSNKLIIGSYKTFDEALSEALKIMNPLIKNSKEEIKEIIDPKSEYGYIQVGQLDCRVIKM